MAQHQHVGHQYPPHTTPYTTALPPQYPPQQPPPQPYPPHPPPQQPPYLPPSHLHAQQPPPLHYPDPHHFPYPHPYDYAAATATASHFHHHHHPPPPQQYPPPPYPHHHHHPYAAETPHRRRQPSKRRREPFADVGGGGSEAPSTKRQAVIWNDVLFRVVVPSGEIGKVIGKGGHRVQRVRDDTKATIKIADPIARFEERVIIISSKEKSDGGMTDAEKALLQIASLILVEDGSSTGISSAADDPYGAGHLAPNAVKLLIAGSQASGLIGVSGQNIEKLRMSSGAAIAVLTPSQLHMCASAHESDRLVQISGETFEVLKALEEIGVELRANPPKQVISISPTYNLSITRAAQPYMDPNAAECVTLDMVISETMVGGLIGRSGSNIGRIRNESGAMIKVCAF
ncbi:hypothetical protein RND81_02G107500 [Saponaria officinalis]|uniref:K Homology domain-containing protein n=1 Tax=Saponaria officinalis TaxID=3572 RepID=A0AAW1MTX2_SAPOF